MMPTLILDTSVLIAGLRSSRGASYVLLGLTADDVRELLDYFCRVGKLSAVRFWVRPSVADPDDELVLEAAIATESKWIVTHNIRDMAVGAARYGIEVIRPGEALRRLEVEP